MAGEAWHLDKRFPVALIATIIIQTGALVWWAAQLSQRVDYVEIKQTAQEAAIGRTQDRAAELVTSTAVLAEQMKTVVEVTKDTNALVQSLAEAVVAP